MNSCHWVHQKRRTTAKDGDSKLVVYSLHVKDRGLCVNEG